MTLSRHLLLAALFCCAHPATDAQALQDPTRPPALQTAADGVDVPAGPQLQSILIARHPGGRHVAVIDGDTVRLGELYKGARVARITDNEVELVRGKERQVLRLAADDEAGTAIKRTARLQ